MAEPITFQDLLILALAFVATKAVAGIISEYAKRIWYKWIEPPISKAISHALRANRRALTSCTDAIKSRLRKRLNVDYAAEYEAISAALAETRRIADRALGERDYWHAEAMRLRIELNSKCTAWCASNVLKAPGLEVRTDFKSV